MKKNNEIVKVSPVVTLAVNSNTVSALVTLVIKNIKASAPAMNKVLLIVLAKISFHYSYCVLRSSSF